MVHPYMSEAVYILDNKLETPKNAFVITFDDGFKIIMK